MEERSIYKDIANRTSGDIYIGVVGPVRTGKSTFIKRFMDTIVLPNIEDEHLRRRTNDELPQSAGGRTIMTTEPKFIPEEAVEVNVDNTATLKVRMIDCVGYVVDSSMGYMEEDSKRMVKTPWSDDEMEFDKAAEIGTKKVINEHSTIGLLITTDGTIGEIEREDYIQAEERVVSELKAINKPFIILLNSRDPGSLEAGELASQLSKKYQVPTLPVNCIELDENSIKAILAQVLFEFPVREVRLSIPKWIVSLEKDHWLKKSIFDSIRLHAEKMTRIREVSNVLENISGSDYIRKAQLSSLDLGKGSASVDIEVDSDLYFKIIREITNIEINDEKSLIDCISELSKKKEQFDKISQAYEQVCIKSPGLGLL